MQMLRTPTLRAFSTKAIPTSSVIQKPLPLGPHCVYVLNATMPNFARRSMSSTSPGWFGFTRPCSMQALRAFEFLDDVARRVRLLDRERLVFARRRHEAQHHEIGIRVEEDILDELVGTDAIEVTALAGPLRQLALRARKLQRLRARRQALGPRAGRVHEVTLHVEDEFAFAELRGRELAIEFRVVRDLEESAVAARASVRGVECEQRGGGAGKVVRKARRVLPSLRDSSPAHSWARWFA